MKSDIARRIGRASNTYHDLIDSIARFAIINTEIDNKTVVNFQLNHMAYTESRGKGCNVYASALDKEDAKSGICLLSDMTVAANPATRGAAWEVPDTMLVAPLGPIHTDLMPVLAVEIVTHLPQLKF